MLWIQVLLSVFFLLAAIKVVARWRAGEMAIGGAFLWILFWLAAIVVTVAPNSTFYFAKILGIGRGADLVVYSALALIFFLIFKITVKIEKINKEITILTRRDSLQLDKKL